MTESTLVDRQAANAPRLIREMQQEREFTAHLQTIIPGADGAAWAQRATTRAERDQRRTQEIVRAMLPEILRMEINEGRRELAMKRGLPEGLNK